MIGVLNFSMELNDLLNVQRWFDGTSSSVHDPNIHVIYYINVTVAATASQSAADDKAENKKMEQDYVKKKWKIWQ